MNCLQVLDGSIESFIREFQNHNKRLFVFQHVPKTAGSSVHVELKKLPNNFHWLGDETTHHSWEDFISRHQTQPWSVLRGHMKSQHLDDLDRRWIKYRAASFLRCPVQQTISHYRYCHSEACPDHEYFRRRYPDLYSFMTKYLKSNFSTEYMVGPCLSVDEALEKISKRFAFIGLTEYYNTSMFLLMKGLGLEFTVKPRVNITTHTSRIDHLLTDAVLEHIDREYAIDVAVFDYFNHRYGALSERVVENCFQQRAAA